MKYYLLLLLSLSLSVHSAPEIVIVNEHNGEVTIASDYTIDISDKKLGTKDSEDTNRVIIKFSDNDMVPDCRNSSDCRNVYHKYLNFELKREGINQPCYMEVLKDLHTNPVLPYFVDYARYSGIGDEFQSNPCSGVVVKDLYEIHVYDNVFNQYKQNEYLLSKKDELLEELESNFDKEKNLVEEEITVAEKKQEPVDLFAPDGKELMPYMKDYFDKKIELPGDNKYLVYAIGKDDSNYTKVTFKNDVHEIEIYVESDNLPAEYLLTAINSAYNTSAVCEVEYSKSLVGGKNILTSIKVTQKET